MHHAGWRRSEAPCEVSVRRAVALSAHDAWWVGDSVAQEADMHRMGWRLSKRLARFPLVTRAIVPFERAGVRLTYQVHDRWLANRESRQLFVAGPPTLDDVQQRIAGGLRTDGVAVIPIDELVPDPALWRQMLDDGDRFVASAERTIGGTGEDRSHLKKKHLVRRHALDVELPLDDACLKLAVSSRLLDIVNSYLGMFAKCLYVDQWYTVPGGPEAERVSSQRWHRDYTDQQLVKVFIYLRDVDHGAGPFEFVLGSAQSGRYSQLWPWRPLGDTYPPPDGFERRIPPTAIATYEGPAGTVIFCNTSGFHRGGFATERPRVMTVYNYASPASLNALAKRNFRLAPATRLDRLPPAGRFALS